MVVSSHKVLFQMIMKEIDAWKHSVSHFLISQRLLYSFPLLHIVMTHFLQPPSRNTFVVFLTSHVTLPSPCDITFTVRWHVCQGGGKVAKDQTFLICKISHAVLAAARRSINPWWNLCFRSFSICGLILLHIWRTLGYILHPAISYAAAMTVFSWLPVYRALSPLQLCKPKAQCHGGRQKEQAGIRVRVGAIYSNSCYTEWGTVQSSTV